MIAVSELVVAVVSSVVVGSLLALLLFLFARLVSKTKRHVGSAASSPWLVSIGALISVVGVVDLIWTQFGIHGFESSAEFRWQAATGPLIVIALGLLVCVAAQILQVLQEGRTR